MTQRRPLTGIRILEISTMGAGPFAGRLLADLGAEVIKIEPLQGDEYRRFGPFVAEGEVGVAFLTFNRNKKSIAIDLKTDDGRQLMLALAARSDAVIENFRPGVLDRLGIGYSVLKEVNPAIVYAAINGFGDSAVAPSPFQDRPAYDLIAQAMSGFSHMTGDAEGPPTRTGIIIGDLVPGVYLALGVVAALLQRSTTGVGARLETTMYEALTSFAERQLLAYSVGGQEFARGQHGISQPYDLYEAKDGWVAITAPANEHWRRFCAVMAREDLAEDASLGTPHGRAANYRAIVQPAVSAWVADRSADEVVETLTRGGVPVAYVQDARAIWNCEHLEARGFFESYKHPVAGEVKVLATPIRFAGEVAEGALKRESPTPPPLLGEHTDEVLRDVVGLGLDEISRLKQQGVVSR